MEVVIEKSNVVVLFIHKIFQLSTPTPPTPDYNCDYLQLGCIHQILFDCTFKFFVVFIYSVLTLFVLWDWFHFKCKLWRANNRSFVPVTLFFIALL